MQERERRDTLASGTHPFIAWLVFMALAALYIIPAFATEAIAFSPRRASMMFGYVLGALLVAFGSTLPGVRREIVRDVRVRLYGLGLMAIAAAGTWYWWWLGQHR